MTPGPGLADFSKLPPKYKNGHKIHTPNGQNIFLIAIGKIFKPFLFQGPPKFTQIGNFGLKIYHLATRP
jgi:hypothetical protein